MRYLLLSYTNEIAVYILQILSTQRVSAKATQLDSSNYQSTLGKIFVQQPELSSVDLIRGTEDNSSLNIFDHNFSQLLVHMPYL